MKRASIIYEVVALLFITMFVYAAISKLLIFSTYRIQLDKQPFDDTFTPFLAWGIPGVELFAVVLLSIPKTRLMGLYVSTFLMILFTGYIMLIRMNYYGSVPCTCGGVISQFTWAQHFRFNLFFLFAGITAIIVRRMTAVYNKLA
jgi:hypothetical protein